MKSDDPELDRVVSTTQIQPLVSRKLPRLVTPIRGQKWQNESDNYIVAKASVTHSQRGTKDPKKPKKLISELNVEGKRGKAKNRRRKLPHGPSVDTSRARTGCEVVRLAIKELGWREIPVARRTGCDFYWLGGNFEIPDYIQTGQLSKFFGMSEAAHKIQLTRQINRLQLLFPHEFTFYPKTWILPEEYGELLAYASKKKKSQTFILKPDGGSQGEGIFLTQNVHDVNLDASFARPSVVQEYIADPYLLDKFKFDLRIYVVLKSLDPLQVYICREGMVRFCTEHYHPPTPKNIFKTYMHLTNYSLNKYSSGYVQSDAGDKGSKQKLSAVFRKLAKEGCDIKRLWADIDKVACQTMIALVPILKLQNQVMSAELKQKLKCFQILGFDILLDKNLKPFLLEVNSSPSLRIDHEEEVSPGKVEHVISATDMEIKLPIVKDSMLLAWQHKRTDDSPPEIAGCLHQIYPKLASQLDHHRVVERCVTLFRHFVGVRTSTRMGPTSFRMMARRCHLTDFGFTLAAFDIMFINMSRRHPVGDSGRAALSFNAFCESLIAIGHKKFSLTMRLEPVEILLTVLKHCEQHLQWPAGKKGDVSQPQRKQKLPSRLSLRTMHSCFLLPTSPLIKDGLL
ncbi:tubulin polyglutamylase TTLL11-like [Montipora foliosa]|uniref:tubulin polyglutamylase TTLL11-like n=1 Tax=Montipora foliosa TaxID=591990 RepID=UPI0035F16CBC